MSALVVMLLLAFFLVIAASLTIWAALGLNQHAPAPAPAPPRQTAARPETPTLTSHVSNDDVRGARVKVTPRPGASDDAFERFGRSDRRRDESEF